MPAALLTTSRTGSGRRLVLVHGFTQTRASWSPIAEVLATDHEVLTVDLPGHGGSSTVVADLAAGADLLAAAVGPATYVGYSLGGRQCLTLALRRPEVIERLVLLGATAGLDDPTERSERRIHDDALATELEQDGLEAFLDRWLALPLFDGLPVEVRTGAARAERLGNTVDGLARSLRQAGTGTMDPPLWDRLGEIDAPTLVLAGERDGRFATLGRRLADGIGPHATFAVVPGAGHAAHLEQPEAFLAVLRPWLAATAGQLG